MKLKILELAETDLFDAFQFYERQAAGIGHYFLDTLIPTLNRFGFTQVSIGGYLAFTDCFPEDSLSLSITSASAPTFRSGACSIVEEIQNQSTVS